MLRPSKKWLAYAALCTVLWTTNALSSAEYEDYEYEYGEDDDPAPITRAPTATPTAGPTRFPTRSPSAPTAAPTSSPSFRPTAFPTAVPTMSPSRTPTHVPTRVPTTRVPTSPTIPPTAAPTAAPSRPPTALPSVSPSAVPSQAPSGAPTMSPSALPTLIPTVEPSISPTAAPTLPPTREPTAQPTASPTAPTATPTSIPSGSPSAAPTTSPSAPTAHPTAWPTAVPTLEPTHWPTQAPSSWPTKVPSAAPTERPSKSPTAAPSTVPTATPTWQPTERPSPQPTDAPTKAPTAPTAMPTTRPTAKPSTAPSHPPTTAPTTRPTLTPTAPTAVPSSSPSAVPTVTPTHPPTYSPTAGPTKEPSATPTRMPTAQPTAAPSAQPTALPTSFPTRVPTAPTASPTMPPTQPPTAAPSRSPTATPSGSPTVNPTAPTALPTLQPSNRPTAAPTELPTAVPTQQPTRAPSAPTAVPTSAPSAGPTASPTKEPSTLAPTTPAPTQDPALSGLCFDFRIAGSDGLQQYTFHPITGFPENHILVQEKVCGFRAAPGQLIPAAGRWSTEGERGRGGESCEEADSSTLFYAYNYPTHASSNVGFEQTDAVMMYFIVDELGTMSLVLTFDLPYDNSGGTLRMNINAPSLAGQSVHFAVRDDPHEPVYADHSQYQWNTSGINENMNWRWGRCCTDGVAFGGLPSDGLTLPFSFTEAGGIDVFKIATYDRNNGTVSFIDINKDLVMKSGFTLATTTCAAYCDSRASCGECSLDPNCGWCETTQSCHSTNLFDTCNVGLNIGEECCSSCTVHTDCSTCTEEAGCAWDHGQGECLSVAADHNGGSNHTYCIGVSPYTTLAGQSCSAVCPGQVASDSGQEIDDWCSGNGTCAWDTGTCVCNSGFAGDGCEVECPGGAANPCSDHGVCSNGECFCECGWTGQDCAEVGCPCNDDVNTTSVCTFGECSSVCGARLDDLSCTGAGIQDTCTCLRGWWGENCTNACPGIDEASGRGIECGGAGTCNVDSGLCACNPCFTSNSSGLCEEDPDVSCLHFGAPACVEFPPDSGMHRKGCACVGMWGGLDCSICQCPQEVSCNPISGDCHFSLCKEDQFTVAPGNATTDTICGNITECTVSQFEALAPTASTDRRCQDYTPPCELPVQFQTAAPTNVSDRECALVTTCSVAQGLYQTTDPTSTSDASCTELTQCGVSEFELIAPSPTSDRNCTPVTECNSTAYVALAATATTDRECANITLECDPNHDLDLVEVALPTATSDRQCAQVDNCDGRPCQNDGRCVDGVHAHTCECGINYPVSLDSNCSIFDACTLQPCQNGGTCRTTASGDAICDCIGQVGFGLCCEKGNGPTTVSTTVCLDSTEAEKILDRQSGRNEANGPSIMSTAAVAAIVLVLLCLVGFAVVLMKRRQRRVRLLKDVQCPRDPIAPIIAARERLKPLFGDEFEVNGRPTAAMRVRGRSMYDRLNGRPSAEYTEANGELSKEVSYTIADNAEGADYTIADGLDDDHDVDYDVGAAASPNDGYDTATHDVNFAFYDQGDNNFDEVYRMATLRPEYAVGASYDMTSTGQPLPYEEAQRWDPDYAGIASDDNYANRPALPDADYGLRHQSPDPDDTPYGLANYRKPAVANDGVYGLSHRVLSPENEYANREDDATYGLHGVHLRLDADAADETYSNQPEPLALPMEGVPDNTDADEGDFMPHMEVNSLFSPSKAKIPAVPDDLKHSILTDHESAQLSHTISNTTDLPGVVGEIRVSPPLRRTRQVAETVDSDGYIVPTPQEEDYIVPLKQSPHPPAQHTRPTRRAVPRLRPRRSGSSDSVERRRTPKPRPRPRSSGSLGEPTTPPVDQSPTTMVDGVAVPRRRRRKSGTTDYLKHSSKILMASAEFLADDISTASLPNTALILDFSPAATVTDTVTACESKPSTAARLLFSPGNGLHGNSTETDRAAISSLSHASDGPNHVSLTLLRNEGAPEGSTDTDAATPTKPRGPRRSLADVTNAQPDSTPTAKPRSHTPPQPAWNSLLSSPALSAAHKVVRSRGGRSNISCEEEA